MKRSTSWLWLSLVVSVVAVACVTDPTEADTDTALGSDNDLAVTLAAAPPTSGTLNEWCSIGPCPEFVEAVDWNRAWFDSETRTWTGRRYQMEPIEVLFPRPATDMQAMLWGLIPCAASYGAIEVFDVAGVSMGTTAYQFVPGVSQPCYDEDYTNGVFAPIIAPRPIARAKIWPPQPLAYLLPEIVRARNNYPIGTMIYGNANPAFKFKWSIVTTPKVSLTASRTTLRPVLSPGGQFNARTQVARYSTTSGVGSSRTTTWHDVARSDSVLLTVEVRSQTGAPVQGNVTFISQGVDSSGGHYHNTGDRPTGRFFALGQYSPTTGGARDSLTAALDSTGRTKIVYRASGLSGSERIIVRSGIGQQIAADTVLLELGVSGLVQLVPTATLDTIGVTLAHPSVHWGTPSMVSALSALADSLSSKRAQLDSAGLLDASIEWPATFKINDMSLQFGGLLDFRASARWENPHLTHRDGLDADVDVRDTSTYDELDRWVQFYWIQQLGHSVNNERQCCNHQHLDY